MKQFFIVFILLLTFTIFTTSISDEKHLKQLKKLFEDGILTEQEFKKAVSLIETKGGKKFKNERIKIRKLREDESGTKFEKLEFYIDNFRIYTFRPGAVRADNLLTGETDVLLKDGFKVELTANGKKYFEYKLDKENLSSTLDYKGRMLISWKGKYVRKHNATFYQMQVLGYKPFHFYIKLPGKSSIALNVDHFTAKIDKAVAKAKEEIAAKYNLTVSDVDRIMEQKENKIDAEIDKVITAEQEKILKELSEKYIGQEINDQIRAEIEKTIGEEMADAFISAIEEASGEAIDAAIEAEIAAAVDEAIAYAIELGVTAAAAAAAIEAMLWVYAMGGSDADALEACRQHAGDAC